MVDGIDSIEVSISPEYALEKLREMQQDGTFNGEPCPECGYSMIGESVSSGPWCPSCKVEQ